MTDDVLFLSAEQVARLLDADTAIASQRAAFTALGAGGADLPPKIMHPSRFDDSVVFAYVSRLSRTAAPSRSSAASTRATRRPGCRPCTPSSPSSTR
jgi:ornithine cyclodeaminase/alanine dehydrogenase-like protein (mu-crystallin family)